ncbi:MAG: acyltransferase [Candidatus Diapherotrites archaeon]|uniref:Acyltransferase n=1 Tax=Candidatus Iainarchaeum sp. TaxID=3101447 RepID=A0A8T4LDJ1_9ARCH|nr:acyltransferase [Candidatus Diapherotrites archaeon]
MGELRFFQIYSYKNLEIGNDVVIGNLTMFDLEEKIILGNNVDIAPHVTFLTHGIESMSKVSAKPSASFRPCAIPGRSITSDPIQIHDHVYIGSGSIILPGVHIGPYALIGAGSVVASSIPPHSVALGNPARVVSTL